MNWLAICRRIRKECGLTGTDSTPSTVVGQTGEMLNVVNWADTAYQSIMGDKLWHWQWEATTVTIAADTHETAGTISHRRYVKDSVYDGTRSMCYMPWDEFRQQYNAGNIQAGDPEYWTIRPDKAFVVSAEPADEMILSVERYANPDAMGGDADEPSMPDLFHMAIVWRAVMLYAGFDESGGLYQHAASEFRRIMGQMAIDGLPEIEPGPALC